MVNSRIKKARLAANMSQEEVAHKLNISQSTYQRWESGFVKVSKKISVNS